MPTQAAPTVPTPEATPQQAASPYPQPSQSEGTTMGGAHHTSTRAGDGSAGAQGTERGGGLTVRIPFILASR